MRCARSSLVAFAIMAVFFGCDSNRSAGRASSSGFFSPEEKIEAVRLVVSWIVEGGHIPHVDPYPDGGIMTTVQRVFVVCEFLPEGVKISDDSRVHRVTRAESDELFEKYNYEGTAYLVIEAGAETEHRAFGVFGSNDFGYLAGQRQVYWCLRS